jgi:hypothetical protein
MGLKWRRVATWDLSRNQQVLFIAEGRDVQYKVTRAGTADKPIWGLYTRLGDGTEEGQCISNLLRDVKSYAAQLDH